jgi:UDP-3-O-[3-hydroxymyristoyl] glucosamine N-acyltransferase
MMSVNNINNNNAAQVQLYAQEKNTQPVAALKEKVVPVSQQTNSSDSVLISEKARQLFANASSITTLGNGEGIEPPKTITGNGEGIEPPVTLGNGEGIEPPKTISGNGEGIEPPVTLGNGEGIEPPKI